MSVYADIHATAIIIEPADLTHLVAAGCQLALNVRRGAGAVCGSGTPTQS